MVDRGVSRIFVILGHRAEDPDGSIFGEFRCKTWSANCWAFRLLRNLSILVLTGFSARWPRMTNSVLLHLRWPETFESDFHQVSGGNSWISA